MVDNSIIFPKDKFEMFMINGHLVATQPYYIAPMWRADHEEVKHYMCTQCGSEWGTRVVPQFSSPSHYFYRVDCNDFASILSPWEWMNVDVLSSNVLAYLILSLTTKLGNENEILKDTN